MLEPTGYRSELPINMIPEMQNSHPLGSRDTSMQGCRPMHLQGGGRQLGLQGRCTGMGLHLRVGAVNKVVLDLVN
jgi:hypothetical protein